jgi:hypothetical protein
VVVVKVASGLRPGELAHRGRIGVSASTSSFAHTRVLDEALLPPRTSMHDSAEGRFTC